MSPSAAASRAPGEETRRPDSSPAAREDSAPSINTLLGTLGLTPSASFGYGVTVALIDSGIYPSTAFVGPHQGVLRLHRRHDVSRSPPFDDYGHGTHVAGLIGGLPERSRTSSIEGVAPAVQFVGLKVLDQNGGGHTSDVIRAIEFAIANKRKFGIDIINLSLGHPIFEPAATDPLVQAVEKATKAGIIVVASAGNHGVNDEGEIGFARHHLARQRAVGDHRRRVRSQRDGDAR